MSEYLSETYYDTVIKAGTYKGWKADYVGMGRMSFAHPEHGNFSVNKGQSGEWMKECWDDFVEFADKLES